MRYAMWIDRHRVRILVGSGALALVLAAIAVRLTVQADLSYLLPPDAPSVVQLRAIEHRARALGTVMVAVHSADSARRAEATGKLRERLAVLVPDEVSSIVADDAIARRFAWEYRWLFVPVPELIAARDALRSELAAAKNPLYVELDDGPAPSAGRLRDRLREAERARDAPAELVSSDGMTQLLILYTAYAPGDIDRDRRLLERVDGAIAAVAADVPGVEIGAAGDVVLAIAEHDAIVDGMLLAVVATVTLVLVGLLVFYRSLYLVGALSWALLVVALATFAFARVAVGHLNLATAFLSSIVVGNGINFGIVVAARYQEARRADATGVACLALTLRSTLAGTLAAALAAAVAYGSLLVTSFRGFRDFAIIASAGIVACWVTAYTVLPAALAIAARRPATARREPVIVRALARLAPANPASRAAALAVVLAVSGAATWRYLAADPFEQDFRRLRSTSAAIDDEARWMARVDRGFGQGISGGYVIAVPDRAAASALVARLRAHDAALPAEQKLFARLDSLDDLVPADQPARLAALGELRGLLADRDVDLLDRDDAALARALRPPAGLAPLRDADVPAELAWPYTEADGTRGRIILAMPGWGYDDWGARDIVRYADDLRALDLGPGVQLGGSTFVFADMIALVTRDGPRATLAAIAGATLLVLALVGYRRHGLATLACGAVGTLAMLALAAVVGLRINFLDFVALPITIGIGIDYAVNLAARDRHDPGLGARRLLARTGSAVLLCSFTTIVGYGSLLLSRNQGIRSFGAASILGEATSLATALVFAPALLVALGRFQRRIRATEGTHAR